MVGIELLAFWLAVFILALDCFKKILFYTWINKGMLSMKKIISPTKKTIYLWGLACFFCLVMMVILIIIQVNTNIEYSFLLLTTIIFGISLLHSVCGLIFNRFYDDGGILSTAFLEACFFVLFFLMAI